MDANTKRAIESYTQPENLAQEKVYLESFKKNVYPIYGEMGFTFAEAVIAFRLSGTETALERIAQAVVDDDEEGHP